MRVYFNNSGKFTASDIAYGANRIVCAHHFAGQWGNFGRMFDF